MKHYSLFICLALLTFSVSRAQPAGLPEEEETPSSLIAGYYSVVDSDDSGVGQGFGVLARGRIWGTFGADLRAGSITYADNDLTMIPLEVDLFFIPPDPLPYIDAITGIGAGYYLFDSDEVSLKNSPGFFLFTGIEGTLYGVTLFLEARYQFLEAESEGILGDLKLRGFGANLGLSYRF